MKKTLGERMLTIPNALMSGKNRQDNVSYGKNPRMIYDEFPSKDKTAPIVMFWHGGGWATGSKEMYRFMGHALQRMGFHALVVGHPLYSEQTFPGFIHDAHAAVEHVRQKYPDRKIFTMGHSAGAHTALIVALSAKAKPVDGVISIAAPCTLAERYWANVFGDSFRDKLHDPRTYIAGSPKQTRYLLLHGAIDYTVVLSDGVSLNRRLKKAGMRSRLHVLKFADHITILPLLAFGPLLITRRRIKKFVLAQA